MSIPFNEYEKRFLLAEIIKASSVPIETLLKIVKDERIEPNWHEIFVPPARNLNACSEAFQELLLGSDVLRPAVGFEYFTPTSKKRRISTAEHATSNTRVLQPKPAANGDFGAVFRSSSDAIPKKRGRPSKDEIAIRQAEAAARGEVYQPAKTSARKSSGVSQLQPATVTENFTSEQGPKTAVSNVDTPTSTRKKRGRPSRNILKTKSPFNLDEGRANIGEMSQPVMEEGTVQHLSEPTPASDADPLGEVPDSNATLHTLLQQYNTQA